MVQADLESRLTPAARQALEELVNDYRNQILFGAEDSASRLTGEVREIAVHDILTGVSRFGSAARRPQSMAERLLSLYMQAGLFVGVIAFAYFAFQDVFATKSFERQLPLLISASGFSLAVLAFIYMRLRRERVLPRRFESAFDGQRTAIVGEFISRWADIELAMRNLASSSLGESIASMPLSLLLSKLSEKQVLRAEDQLKLKELLQLRNAIVHSRTDVPVDMIQGALKSLEVLRHRIARNYVPI